MENGVVSPTLDPAQSQKKDRAALDRRDSWIVGVVFAMVLFAWDIARTYPPFPPELSFNLILPVGDPQHPDPLVATGAVGQGDFLSVNYLSADTATFAYEAWGRPAISSPPLKFQAGAPIKVRLKMPALLPPGHSGTNAAGELRLLLEGLEVLHQQVPFHPCRPTRIFFGENPVGGQTVGSVFHGLIRTDSGRRVHGNPDAFFSPAAKCAEWIRTSWWHVLPILLASAGAAWLLRRVLERPAAAFVQHGWAGAAWSRHRWFIICATINVLVFTWLMTGGKFRLIYPDAFGAFYEFQAQSLLHGHLDVPFESLGSEAFLVNGKAYGYFGPTPALLRMPFVVAGIGFGHMTRSFMLADYVACLAAAYLCLLRVTRMMRGDGVRPSPWAMLLLLASVGLGSSLLFLASRAYVYHEAILCGAAFALWAIYFALRYLEDRHQRWWLAALACGALSVQARPPSGLFALVFLGCVALYHLFTHRHDRNAWRQPVLVGALAAAAFSSLFAVAYLKFGTLDGAPLRYHVQYDATRLAKIEGKNFHLANVRHNLDAYFLAPAFEAGLRLPFFIFDVRKLEEKKHQFPEAKMDLQERVVGVLYAMAGLVGLSAAGIVAGVRDPRFRGPMLLTVLAAAPLLFVMLTFVATSHRYTADFCPMLVLAGTLGLVYLDSLDGAKRMALLGVASLLTAFAFALTLGLSFHYRVDLVWGVPEELRNQFLHLREIADRWCPGG